MKIFYIYSGNMTATIKAITPSIAITQFLTTVNTMEDVVLDEVIGINEVGTPPEESDFVLTAMEAGLRHLIHNRRIVRYLNENQMMDDSRCDMLRDNAKHWKTVRPGHPDGNITWVSERKTDDENPEDYLDKSG